MAYNPFTNGKPVSSDNGLVAMDHIRYNLMAMRDALIMGAMSGWDMTTPAGTTEKPTQILYTNKDNTSEQIRLVIEWGTTGGGTDNVVKVSYDYTSNNGTNWEWVGPYRHKNIVYNTDGTVESANWSAT